MFIEKVSTRATRESPRTGSDAERRGCGLAFDNLSFRYDPYPIGAARPVLGNDVYERLLDRYPSRDLFAYMPKFGHKYTLSEKFNADAYHRFLGNEPLWREFHDWVKSEAFIVEVMNTLRGQGIDLGFDEAPPPSRRLIKSAKRLFRRSQKPRGLRLSSRFEFSMLPADGGSVLPHTDLPSKIVTIIVSMVRDGEWDASMGGGTDVNRTRDPRLNFNRLNARGRFEDMEILDTFEFLPNQAVIFVKTFNSWHSVRPMTGAGSPAMRRTLTINIEAR